MKKINIYVYAKACMNLRDEKYIDRFHSITTGRNCKFNNNENECLIKLIENIKEESNNIEIFENFFWGYTIPNISKEFDLLKIDNSSVVNIEMKRTQKKEKVKKQLTQNKYYLKFLNKDIYLFTYLKEENKLYSLENDELVEVEFYELINVLDNLENIEIDIEKIFIPKNYLISPFNDTNRFINNEYFLTDEQNEKKHEILSWVNINHKSICIRGKAGSGKTLLLYDLYKELSYNNKKVVAVHCGVLNEGHCRLKEEGFEIIPIKKIEQLDYNNIDYILIDEAQRININQFKILINKIKETKSIGIFSYDPRQTLSLEESRSESIKILNSINNVARLKGRIRSNKDIYNFINCLFDKTKYYDSNFIDIKINYFNDYNDAMNYTKKLIEKGWMYPEFSTSQYYITDLDKYILNYKNSSHRIIGQEFDRVVIIIDENFYYNSENKLRSRRINGVKYDAMMMLYQNITRAKDKLSIVIINNKEILERIINLIKIKQ